MSRISWVLVFALACRKEGDTDGVDTSDTEFVDADGDGFASDVDCDDADAAVSPDAQEVCDADDVDEDCDGTADDADTSATGQTKGAVDADGDGYGALAGEALACDPPTNQGDCDDTNASVSPGALEVCDALDVDEDCDGAADDADDSATGQTKGPADLDGDTWAGNVGTALACDPPQSGDCDDSNAFIGPAMPERCDSQNVDENCNGLADDEDPDASGQTKGSYDGDGDGYAGNAGTGLMCDHPELSNDCDDTRPEVYPGALEICDGVQDDCDALTWVNDDGRVTENATVDLSAAWAAGTVVVPVVYAAPDGASVAICGGAWHVRLKAAGPAVFTGYGAATIAPGAGSGLELTAATSDVQASDLVFLNGTATTVSTVRYGGNVYAPLGTLLLRDVTLQGGSANNGGNLYVGAAATAVIEGGFINGGLVTNQGGGIYAAGSLVITDTTLELNMGMFGAGIYLASSSAEITGATLTGNVAADTGGGLYAIQSVVASTDSSYRANDAARAGGLRLDTTTFSGANNRIQYNTIAPTGQGGGVSMAGSTLTSAGSIIGLNLVEDVRTEAGATSGLDGNIVCSNTGCVVN